MASVLALPWRYRRWDASPSRRARRSSATSGNFISFRAPAEEAARIARQLPGLSAGGRDGLGALPRRRTSDDEPVPLTAVTGRTLALPAPTGQAARSVTPQPRVRAAHPRPRAKHRHRRPCLTLRGRSSDAPGGPHDASRRATRHVAQDSREPPYWCGFAAVFDGEWLCLPQSLSYLTPDRLHQTNRSMSNLTGNSSASSMTVALLRGAQLIRAFWQTEDATNSPARRDAGRSSGSTDWRVLDPLPGASGGSRGSAGLVYCVGRAGVRLLAVRGITGPRVGAPGDAAPRAHPGHDRAGAASA